jgi:hypothetical protein
MNNCPHELLASLATRPLQEKKRTGLYQTDVKGLEHIQSMIQRETVQIYRNCVDTDTNLFQINVAGRPNVLVTLYLATQEHYKCGKKIEEIKEIDASGLVSFFISSDCFESRGLFCEVYFTDMQDSEEKVRGLTAPFFLGAERTEAPCD